MNIPFRTDEYGKNFYLETDGKVTLIPYKLGTYTCEGINFDVSEKEEDGILEVNIKVSANETKTPERFGMRLGIDTYMESYPEWNDKFFPTALRCEKNGFWSCFQSPLGKMVSVCSPSKIVCWRNEYNRSNYDGYDDVGHRIYTASIEFVNTLRLPERHPESPKCINSDVLEYTIYYSAIEDEKALGEFIEKYAHIHIPSADKYTLEKGEAAVIDGKVYDGVLKDGLNLIKQDGSGEAAVYVRKDWFYYLDCARKNAEKCQQKPGTHCESWYGYFSRIAYAKETGDKEYIKTLCAEFDKFFDVVTLKVDDKVRMEEKTLPHRLQNTAILISILADMYELSGDEKYLNNGADLAQALIEMQYDDGSYRRHGTHYTCVIYPAKSMIELAIAERAAGHTEKAEMHYQSAYKAIKNLEFLKDNIETEGQMTFEDGMISCEALQLAYLAMLLPEGSERENLTAVAIEILEKHACLEQHFVPDCKTRGCTLRYWESRYDLNFFANILNSPHGWTSWKNYASYYLYILTGNLYYLKDLMDTMGACMQCVDENGELNWGYAIDPCVVGENIIKNCTPETMGFEKITVGEQYLPMISDWYRQGDDELKLQYIRNIDQPETWERDFGGSCDNDVHEHFKCLHETVFGKSFIHEGERETVTYNCKKCDGGYKTDDKYVKTIVVYSQNGGEIVFDGKVYTVKKGMNVIEK